MKKPKLLTWLRDEQQQWEALLNQIGPARMDQPGVSGPWSMKDLVAHLTGWNRYMVTRLQAAQRGEPEPLPPWPAQLQAEDDELDPAGLVPEKPYTQDELWTYLAYCREKGQATIEALTGETALRRCRFPWGALSFAELLLDNMRHVQEHTAQLNLLLGQKIAYKPGWVVQAQNHAA